MALLHQRGALGNRCFQVMRHAHRKCIKRKTFGLQAFGKFAKKAKGTSLLEKIAARRRNCHQAPQPQSWQCRDGMRQVGRRSRVVGIFPNEASVIRLVGMILTDTNDEWTIDERRYLSEGSMALLTTLGDNQTVAAITGSDL